MMGLYKLESRCIWIWRAAKTVFFLVNMLASLLLVCAPPLLIVLLDVLLPSALLCSSLSWNRTFSIPSSISSSQLKSYSFGTSLVDVPLLSIARSLLILCAYIICEGRGPYLGIAAVCSLGSIGFVSVKAATMIIGAETGKGRALLAVGGREAAVVEALFLCSVGLAMAHVLVAYRTSCRERRKLLVYKIDIEAIGSGAGEKGVKQGIRAVVEALVGVGSEKNKGISHGELRKPQARDLATGVLPAPRPSDQISSSEIRSRAQIRSRDRDFVLAGARSHSCRRRAQRRVWIWSSPAAASATLSLSNLDGGQRPKLTKC